MNPKLLKTVPKIGGDLGRSFDDLLKDVSVDGK